MTKEKEYWVATRPPKPQATNSRPLKYQEKQHCWPSTSCTQDGGQRLRGALDTAAGDQSTRISSAGTADAWSNRSKQDWLGPCKQPAACVFSPVAPLLLTQPQLSLGVQTKLVDQVEIWVYPALSRVAIWEAVHKCILTRHSSSFYCTAPLLPKMKLNVENYWEFIIPEWKRC